MSGKIEELSSAIDDALGMYSKEIEAGIRKEVDISMKKLVMATKRDAPVRTGAYKKAISCKKSADKSGAYSKVWYVKAPHYRLAHLLNNGHAKRGGGRINGDDHITKNEKAAVSEFQRAVKEVIRESGD